MVLTKDELSSSLKSEVRLILHLASKIEPSNQDFRPTAKQRTTLELLRYLALMGPVHLRGVLAETWDMESWRDAWNEGNARVQNFTLEETKAEIAKHPALYAELLDKVSDEALRQSIEMFGAKGSRGQMLVMLVLSHYAAYRMQLFQYLKASGREELNTLNLWVGIDGAM